MSLVRCDWCKEVLDNRSLLKAHQQTPECVEIRKFYEEFGIESNQSEPEIIPTMVCLYCKYAFSTHEELEVHTKSCPLRRLSEYNNCLLSKYRDLEDKLRIMTKRLETLESKVYE